jgi:hypothetical protein
MRLPIIICFLIPSPCFGQFMPSAKLEVGVNSLGFNRGGKMGGGEESFTRSASPLVGVALTHNLLERSYVSVGIQYTSTGAVESYYRKRFSQLDQYYHVIDENEKFEMRKFCVPVLTGYRFSIRNAGVSVFGGVKVIRYTGGRYQYHYTLKEDGNTTIDRYKSFNPFDNNSLRRQASKTNVEVSVGTDVIVYKKISLALSYSVPIYMVYFEEELSGSSGPDVQHRYWKPDLSLSLNWIVTRKKE